MGEFGEGEIAMRTIDSVRVIPENRNQIISERRAIPELVEAPLVSACEDLYDKNILTLSSSANSKDINFEKPIESFAYIIVDEETLSEDNREVADALVKEGKAVMLENYDGNKAIQLRFPLSETTLIEELQTESLSVARRFSKQIVLWVPQMTIDFIAEMYMTDEVKSMNPIELAREIGYFYDEESKLFYLSKEHYDKVSESEENLI